MTVHDVVLIVLIIVAVIATPIVLRKRRRSHQRFLEEYCEAEICEHLRGAFELLKSRGHRIVRAGQVRPNMPLEVHLAPAFDPKELAKELDLKEPVFVSERNVLGCREDWCELHPK
ncbi:MAG TPA: hypothetical protein VHP11_11885 [Tepidisphaeraceae bacterium]|nr:hypothetical protein [Tepidisphaeraceae bacterium]